MSEIFKAAHSCLTTSNPGTVRGGIPAVSSGCYSLWRMKDFHFLVIASSFAGIASGCSALRVLDWAGHPFPASLGWQKCPSVDTAMGYPQLVRILPAEFWCWSVLQLRVRLNPSALHGQRSHLWHAAPNCCPENYALFCSDVIKLTAVLVLQARLCLFQAARLVLASGMKLLGITPVTQM